MASDDDGRRRWDVVPLLVLAFLVLLMLAGWWLYPKLQHFLSEQDCIATGRTNCS